MALHLVGHAATGVGDREGDVRSGWGVEVLLGVGGVEIDVGGLDDELAAARHGVAGVDHQIENHLVHLARIGLDVPEVRVELRAHLDILAEQAQHHLVVGDDSVEAEDDRAGDLLAAEQEQLAGEAGGAFGGVFDVEQAFGERGGALLSRHGFHAAEQEFTLAEDDGEEIVEVVGNAAGQPPDGLHLLGVAKLCFELLLLAAVGEGQHGAAERAVLHDGIAEVLGAERFAVGARNRRRLEAARLHVGEGAA
jgi:hypothetical protein